MDRLFAPAEQAAASSHAGIPYSRRTVMSRRQFCATSIGGLLAMSSASSAMSAEGYLDPEVVRESYRKPNATESIVIEPRTQYPYSFSPWEYMCQQELEQLGDSDKRKETIESAMVVATNVANRAAEFLTERVYQKHRLARDKYWRPSATQALTLASFDTDLLHVYVECIGEALLEAGYSFRLRTLISNAFDPHCNSGSRFTLDCDLLVYMALHAAFRHDIPLAAVPSPGHMYLGSFEHKEWAAELTDIGKKPLRTTHEKERRFTQQELVKLLPTSVFMRLNMNDPMDYLPCTEAYLKHEIDDNVCSEKPTNKFLDDSVLHPSL